MHRPVLTSRRAFVRNGLLLAGGSVTSTELFADLFDDNVATAPDFPQPELFIFDSRYQQARTLATKIGSQGIALANSEGELTQLWTGHLKARWEQGTMTLAGLTTRSDLFVLSTLAADYRMKLLYEEEVPCMEGGGDLYAWVLGARSVQV